MFIQPIQGAVKLCENYKKYVKKLWKLQFFVKFKNKGISKYLLGF